MSATTTAAPAATTSSAPKGQDNGKSNNPLLFFVALGFGVVFTNLWIIVGVKYCFRYNARARAARMVNEHGEPIDLGDVPQQHRRRRKEKKLMSMQEVNERFPLTKYKVFRSTREGVAATTPSRPATARGEEAATVVVVGKTPEDAAPPHTALAIAQQDHASAATGTPRPSQDANREKKNPTIRSSSLATNDEEDDEDDPIRTAAPAEMLDVAGDTCAICIDTLDDDDDVRGLTCGHAFHGSCVDPWLTSRRACCPLCKADYYVPKQGRGGAGEGEEGAQYPGMPQHPAHAWIGHGGFRPHMMLTSRGFFLGDPLRNGTVANGTNTSRIRTANSVPDAPPPSSMMGVFGRLRPGGGNSATTTPTAGQQTTNSTDPNVTTETPSAGRSWRSMMPRLTRGSGTSAGQQGDLEAGTRVVR